MVLGDRPYGKLVERDDKPLPAKEARKEQEKVEKESAKRERESASDKAKEDKDRAEERRYLREVPEAFVLTLQGEIRSTAVRCGSSKRNPSPATNQK